MYALCSHPEAEDARAGILCSVNNFNMLQVPRSSPAPRPRLRSPPHQEAEEGARAGEVSRGIPLPPMRAPSHDALPGRALTQAGGVLRGGAVRVRPAVWERALLREPHLPETLPRGDDVRARREGLGKRRKAHWHLCGKRPGRTWLGSI
jgi:hypothetical protein